MVLKNADLKRQNGPLFQRSDLLFHKYQALGNDFVILDNRDLSISSPVELSRLICKRNFGIGSDGLVLISPDSECVCRMEFFNPDGSRAEMCGNGIRCVASFLRDSGSIGSPSCPVDPTCESIESTSAPIESSGFRINTDVGPKILAFVPEGISVNLGKPSFFPEDLPALFKTDLRREVQLQSDDTLLPKLPPATCLSVGNPHCVLFVDKVKKFPVKSTGKMIENLSVFPNRINVIFVSAVKPDNLLCRVWERGAGETQACGTGAAAALIAATLRGISQNTATVKLPGGDLKVNWSESDGVTIAGDASRVFTGTIGIPSNLLRCQQPCSL